jgi:hypothetical protein
VSELFIDRVRGAVDLHDHSRRETCENGERTGVRKRLKRLLGGWAADFGHRTLNPRIGPSIATS